MMSVARCQYLSIYVCGCRFTLNDNDNETSLCIHDAPSTYLNLHTHAFVRAPLTHSLIHSFIHGLIQ